MDNKVTEKIVGDVPLEEASESVLTDLDNN